MGLNRNINDDSTLAYLFNKTRQGASDALQKAIDAINSAIDTINDTLTSIQTTLNNKVSKTGDTMTGDLNMVGHDGDAEIVIKNDQYARGDTPGSNSNRRILFTDKNDANIALVGGDVLSNGTSRARLTSYGADGTTNELAIYVAPDGTRSIGVTNAGIWRTALNAVNKAGDTMTGRLVFQAADGGTREVLHIKDHEMAVGTDPPANTYDSILFKDKNDVTVGFVRYGYLSDGRRFLQFSATAKNGSTTNYFNLGFDASGNPLVGIPSADRVAWLDGLGLGTSGALPITIAQGGTGQTGTATTITTASQIATAATSFEVTSASYTYWGKVAMVIVNLKCTTAVTSTSGTTVCTLVSGKRPALALSTVDNTGGRLYINTNGACMTYRAISANATFAIRTCYLLA